MPKISGSKARAGLIMYLTFHWLPALLMYSPDLYDEVYAASESLFTL